MMKKKISIFIFVLTIFVFLFIYNGTNVSASSYLSDKAEIAVTLTSTGARSICQTDDGYVWIGQFAGLNRYDSKELISYNSYEDETGKIHTIENVKCLANYHNVLFASSSTGLIRHENNEFQKIEINASNLIINDLLMTDEGKLYISTNVGLYVYDEVNKKLDEFANHKEAITSVAVYGSNIFILKDEIVVDEDNNVIFNSEIAETSAAVNSVYVFNNLLAIGTKNGNIYFYDLVNNKIIDNVITLSQRNDVVHQFKYSEKDNILFAACEKGLYSIDVELYKATYAKKLEKSSKIVDLMIDYENNLWIASYIDGVSIITKSSLVDVLFDVEDQMPNGRLVYAMQKYGNDLFMATGSGIYVYDLVNEKLNTTHPLVAKINEMMEYDDAQKKIDSHYDVRIPYYDVRDVEIFKGKLYFATYGSGLIEFDPATNDVKQYRGIDIAPEDPNANSQYYAAAHRCLCATDNYLFIGTATNSIIRFDGTGFIKNKSVPNMGQILYIAPSAFGQITFVGSGSGIHTINENLENESIASIPGIDETTSGILKFYQDGDNFFYNIYGRFFLINTKDGNYSEPKEIKIPYVNGSITEINKIKAKDSSGNEYYKYVLASEKQIYIIDDLLADEIVYEFYDSSNGLKSPIKGNSSGYYDGDNFIYYFQSQDGVFAYNFVKKDDKRVPLLIDVNSVSVDGKSFFSNNISLDKNADRIVFNLSVFSFKPTKGYTIYYKLDGVDQNYIAANDNISSVNYTNIAGGTYKFHAYVVDELNQISNQIDIDLTKAKHIYEEPWFWVFVAMVGIAFLAAINLGSVYVRDKKAKERENELKGVTIESIEAIARTIDAKDTYTNGHSIRVGHFSRIIAQELGMKGDELENLYYIALLHDIGKIGIPDAILNKPGRLTDEEFAIMKSHTTKGAKILADISTIPNIVEGAKYHHERYGGGGYPEGLKGEDIPYIARIICCADCFDAMATRRVYKDPYPRDKIISEFERCKETQFDPKIADVVIKLIKEGRLKTEE